MTADPQPAAEGTARALRVDLNADVGEGSREDETLTPLVSSVNICCGAHAGDEATIRRTVGRAIASGAAIGAHPGYPDREGFGRRPMAMSAEELEASLLEQIRLVMTIAAEAGAAVVHVKPHGALYNGAARDPGLAGSVARAVHAASPELILVGLAGSELLAAGRACGLEVAREAFADRAYEGDGSLRSRELPGAMLGLPAEAAAQAVAICRDRRVAAWDGTKVSIEADTICLHGDTPGAADRARAVRTALEAAGVEVGPLELRRSPAS